MLEGCTKTYTVWDVAHIPDVSVNLLAVNVMQSRGVYFDGRTATLRQVTDDKLVAKCPVVDGLYQLQIVAPTALTTATASVETSKPSSPPKASLMEWHSRLGHISLDCIQALAKAGHITITDNTKELCTSCGPAKSKQQISREPQRRATRRRVRHPNGRQRNESVMRPDRLAMRQPPVEDQIRAAGKLR